MPGITSIRELVSQGCYRDALNLYARLRFSHSLHNNFTFPSLLLACGKMGSLFDAQNIHIDVLKTGLLSDVYTSTALTSAYVKLHQMKHATVLFDEIPHRNIAAPNAIISGFCRHARFQEALSLFRELQADSVQPNSVTFASILPACGHLKVGRTLHCFVTKLGSELDVYVATAVLTMYWKCRDAASALKVFLSMPCRKVESYNAMMSGGLQNGFLRVVVQVFEEMRKSCKVIPNLVSWLAFVSACSDMSAFSLGRQVHCFLLKTAVNSDAQLGTAIVDMYSRCGPMELALQIFRSLSPKNLVAWNSLISGAFLHGRPQIAVDLFHHLSECLVPDAVTWNAMVSGFSHLGDAIGAFTYFYKMQLESFVGPNVKLLTSVLFAAGRVADLRRGKGVHCYSIRVGFNDDKFVSTAIINMYMKCGCPNSAHQVFDMVDTESKDVAMWNAVIDGYGKNGNHQVAVEIFSQMQKCRIQPNSATFLSLISASGHSGQVENARELFEKISKYGLNPSVEHYSSMIDLLGRFGNFYEAQELSGRISEPSVSVLASLLGSCRLLGNVEHGERVAKQLAELEPGNPLPYVLLSIIYADKGMWSEAGKIWDMMKTRGLKKVPGCSWIAGRN